jgi:FkbM family methyltransferase
MKQPLKTLKLGVRGFLNHLGYSIVKLPPKRPPPPKLGQTSEAAVVLVGGRPIKIHRGNPLCDAYQMNPQLNCLIGIGAEMVRHRFPDSWAVDVGANVGDTLAVIKGKAAMPVICVEGDPVCYELLEENARQFEEVFLVKTFLSDKPGETKVELQKSGWNTTLTEAKTDGSGQRLQFQTLDQVVQGLNRQARVKLLKVDTEGYDLRILRGAAGILERDQPVITFELNRENVEPLGDSVGDFFDYLVKLNYHHFILNDPVGGFICALNEQNRHVLLDLYQYSYLGRPIYYFDIWVFHRSDRGLFECFLAQERARSRQS